MMLDNHTSDSSDLEMAEFAIKLGDYGMDPWVPGILQDNPSI
jgi:hypothetical protein